MQVWRNRQPQKYCGMDPSWKVWGFAHAGCSREKPPQICSESPNPHPAGIAMLADSKAAMRKRASKLCPLWLTGTASSSPQKATTSHNDISRVLRSSVQGFSIASPSLPSFDESTLRAFASQAYSFNRGFKLLHFFLEITVMMTEVFATPCKRIFGACPNPRKPRSQRTEQTDGQRREKMGWAQVKKYATFSMTSNEQMTLAIASPFSPSGSKKRAKKAKRKPIDLRAMQDD